MRPKVRGPVAHPAHPTGPVHTYSVVPYSSLCTAVSQFAKVGENFARLTAKPYYYQLQPSTVLLTQCGAVCLTAKSAAAAAAEYAYDQVVHTYIRSNIRNYIQGGLK